MNKTKIIIGTRGSRLSLIQTDIVKNLLFSLVPEISIQIKIIKTAGDKNMNPIPLDTVGKGWFTKEIDRELLENKIDLAVHSLKDLLDDLNPELTIAAIPEREDPREVLVSKNNIPLHELKRGTIIGTDSIRRKIQVLKKRKDFEVKSLRGNVNRRIEKLDSGEYDALLLAAAGLKRLGIQNRITEYFDPEEFIPSPGQGALAVVSKKNNTKLNKILTKLNHKPSVITTRAEREFSRISGGSCSAPIAAYAEIKKGKLILHGMIGSEDCKYIVKNSIYGRLSAPKSLARKLADKILKHVNF